MQMNKATVLAILAFTTSALAQYNDYSYGNEVHARDAEADYDIDFSLYGRDAEYEDDSFQLSARDEAYLDGYLAGLARRDEASLIKDQIKSNNKGIKNDKNDMEKQKHRKAHAKAVAALLEAAKKKDTSKMDALKAEMKALEAKLTGENQDLVKERHKAVEAAKAYKNDKTDMKAKQQNNQDLSARDFGEEEWEYEY